ncbi:phage scaffolding protein [Lysinibacillus sphaericus]|uniref:phage scaffolding protein n=1 Tax=Lysinibacillus sphaericus TaxID=1421 RepID=UPI003F7A151F
MDWLKELLKTAGIADEQVETIVANAAKEAPKHVVPKAKYNELSTAKSSLETQLLERDTQLTDLQKQAKGNEDLEKTIKELQDANKTATEKYEADINAQKIESAIDLEFTTAKARNLTAAKALLDREGLYLDKDGKTVVGLADRVKALVEGEETKFVFDSTETVITGTTPGGQPGGGGNPVDTSKMTYTQMVAYQQANPEAKL